MGKTLGLSAQKNAFFNNILISVNKCCCPQTRKTTLQHSVKAGASRWTPSILKRPPVKAGMGYELTSGCWRMPGRPDKRLEDQIVASSRAVRGLLEH
jgi:hypothetical protein